MVGTLLRKGNLKRETESLFIKAVNKSIRATYIFKVKVNIMQEKSNSRIDSRNGQSHNKSIHQTGMKRMKIKA